ncbi:hypothetical protein I2I11_07220 [Pontibacter sp. 172403-2]|uniref:DUF6970 domain-containing protein n=1 Tax=Pontibacter rufus TaxID=2791028 RepID=UPI0018AF83A8|nr:hypothetical protein [Pontibacter sp. 172403-2]MBF9253077.1 hypothetical protein [Pontibacter sp. 172403-2]
MATQRLCFGALPVLLVCLLAACRPGLSPQIPDGATANALAAPWLSQLIQQLQEDKPANPPAKIYRYTYHDQEVYYLTSRCCDIPGKVYDMYGNVLCEPDGGITGKGDGRCPDFFEQRKNETLIWEDKREH